MTKKSWEGGINSIRTYLLNIEASLSDLATEQVSRKGSAEMLPRHQSKACYQRGRCTIYPRAHRMYLVVRRAVPWSLKAKNREKARERFYLPVCLHLTRKGTGPKGLMVTRRENRSAKSLPFSFLLEKQQYC